jgi:hypothetical protein
VAFGIQEKIQVGTVDCRKYNLYGYGGRDVLWNVGVFRFFFGDTLQGSIIVVKSTLDKITQIPADSGLTFFICVNLRVHHIHTLTLS